MFQHMHAYLLASYKYDWSYCLIEEFDLLHYRREAFPLTISWPSPTLKLESRQRQHG
jgi:hypothetical protein